MNSLLRSWRVLMLAWAVLLAPQLSLVHALSHVAPASGASLDQAAGSASDERQQTPDNLCGTCLALAQVGSALPASHFAWQAPAQAPMAPQAQPFREPELRTLTAFLARGPPLL